MSRDSASSTRHSFLATARRLRLLDEDTLAELEAEATRRGIGPAELALSKGLLSDVQMDIVETMRRPTEIVPGYEILEVAGKGGMGIVYRARQLNLDRIVALKTLLVSQIEDATLVNRFEREARTVASLRHPNIVAAYDFGRHGGRLFFVMEYVDGRDAGELIEQARSLTEATTWGLIRQTAAGLAHAASQNVVHRDIKPANLLLVVPPEGLQLPTGLPMVKIADFGLAYLRSDVETISSGRIAGSPHYMAPEQLQSAQIDHRADIYALGATALQMLSGTPPFHGLTLTQIVAAKINGTTPELPRRLELSPESVNLVRAMMEPDVHSRIQDYRQIISRIDTMNLRDTTIVLPDAGLATAPQTVATEAIAGTVELARPGTGSTQSFDRPAKSHARPWFFAVSAMLLVTLVLLLIVPVARHWRERSRSPGERTLVPSGWAAYLFDGDDLQPWLQGSSGTWTTATNSEGARVLAGTGGIVRRQLTRLDGTQAKPLDHYQLTVLVDLHQAAAAEIRFGIERSEPLQYHVVRIATDEIVFGEQRADEFIRLAGPRPRDGPDRPHTVVVERQEVGWWVELDGSLFGAVTASTQSELPELQLAVHGGPAWFSDISVEELTPAE